MDLQPLLILALIMSLNGLLLLLLLAWRWRFRYTERQKQVFLACWQPLLIQWSLGQKPALPRLNPQEQLWFLQAWNARYQTLRGPVAAAGLHDILEQVGLRPQLLAWLQSHRDIRRLLAVQTLGFLREQKAWEPLVEIALQQQGMLALLALRSLLLISPEAAIPVLLNGLRQQQDWSRARLLGMMRRLPFPAVAGGLGQALQALEFSDPVDNSVAQTLVKMLTVIGYPHVLPVIRQTLKQAQEPELIITCLQALGSLKDYSAVPSLHTWLQHPNWTVRLHAVKTLGVLATANEIPLLLERLADSNWWVRYRAVAALYGIPGIRLAKLAELQQSHPRPEVREILNYYHLEQAQHESHH